MIEQLAAQLAFLGNFHPIAVHFPLALLPVALGLKCVGYWKDLPRFEDVGQSLLKLSLLLAVATAFLGITNAQVNGFSWNKIQTHASLAWLSIIVLAIALLLPDRREPFEGSVAVRFKPLLTACGWLFGTLWWLLKWALIILFFPVVLIFILLRKLYRITIARFFNPIFKSIQQGIQRFVTALWQQLATVSTLRNWKNFGYGASLLLISVAGLHGANLVHGQGHLARHAPEWAIPLLGGAAEAPDAAALSVDYFQDKVAPILRKNCMKCHGEDKAKGKLRLDKIEHIVDAGVIQTKAPMNSELIHRVLLHRDDPRAMPPKKNGRGLTGSEVGTLLAWINNELGAESDGENGPVVPPLYASINNSLPPISNQTIASLNQYHALAFRVQEDHHLLSVNMQFVEAADREQVVEMLTPYTDHIIDLNAAGIHVDDSMITLIAKMKNLLRLNLSRGNTDDQKLVSLNSLRRLQWLNLYQTDVTELSDKTLKAMHSLETVHL